MNSQPPPVPGFVPSEENSFARQAANACLAAPLILIGLSFCLKSLLDNHRDESGRSLILVIGIVGTLTILAGIVFGLVALILARPGERAGVFARAGIGLGICGMLVALSVPNFVRARSRSIANHAAMQEVTSAASDLRKDAAEALQRQGTRPVNLAKLDRTLDHAAKTTSGDSPALFRAMQAYVRQMEAQQAAYEDASDALLSFHVLQTSNLIQRSEIAIRKVAVQKFLDANNGFKTFVRQSSDTLRKELVSQGATKQQTEAAIAGFQKTSSIQIPTILEVRAADDRMGYAMLGVLNLLDANWGRWRYSPEIKRVRFEDRAVLEEFNSYLNEIQQAAVDQQAAQKRLAVVLKQPIRPL